MNIDNIQHIQTYEDFFHITVSVTLSDEELKFLSQSSVTVRREYVADLLDLTDEFVDILEKEFNQLFPQSVLISGKKYYFRKDVAEYHHYYGAGFSEWLFMNDYFHTENIEYPHNTRQYDSREAKLFSYYLTDTYRPLQRKLNY